MCLTNQTIKTDTAGLIEYLDYYNNRRIKAKLKGLPPAIHRQQALSAA
ncbi:MAG: IS3 family transposase [Oscillospiraceae bacterium]